MSCCSLTKHSKKSKYSKNSKNSKNKPYSKIHPEETIGQPKSILKNKRVKRNSIYPQENNLRKNIIEDNKRSLEEEHKNKDAFTKHFLSEVIQCGACQDQFTLGDHAIKINCGSCNQFFHCSIAGACVGPNCSVILDGKKESLKYCMGCVNPYLKINIMDNGLSLCKICEYDPYIDKEYLKV